ncbi:MAG: uridine kinase [Gammaproteobacteria bacterium]|nr:uridine kinase [Gammaproteobacteria bacterium]MCH9744206.1 uridine kinase [Gammaproteobacteria bacterium]
MSDGSVIIIGISGPTASGKSLLANTIIRELGSDQVIVIPEDCYYKHRPDMDLDERAKVNYDHPDAFDHDLLVKNLQSLRNWESVDIPQYDFATHQRKQETKHIPKSRIIILEGILLFAEQSLRDMMDIRIFMDTALDICLLRRLRRDIVERGRSLESVLNQYQNTVRPMYFQFVEPSKRYADVIVPRGGENRIAIDMIKAKMRELLTSK